MTSKNQGNGEAKTTQSNSNQGPALQAVLDHQMKLSKAREALQALQAVEADLKTKEARAVELDHELNALTRRVEDLMADIAAGESKQAELDEVRKKQSTNEAEMEALYSDDYDAALTGLARKIDRAKVDLAALEGHRPSLMRAMLLERAEAMGAEYAEAALKTADLCKRLIALNRLLQEHGRSVSLVTGAGIEIPLFELDSVRGHADFHLKGHIVRGHGLRGQTLHIEQEEREFFTNLGVDLTREPGED